MGQIFTYTINGMGDGREFRTTVSIGATSVGGTTFADIPRIIQIRHGYREMLILSCDLLHAEDV
jgi:hypothetical protein